MPPKQREAPGPRDEAAQGAAGQEKSTEDQSMLLEDGWQSSRVARAPGAGGGAGAPAAWYAPSVGAPPREPGPFRAEQIRPGEPYEVSDGHRVACLPTGGRGSGPNGFGVSVLGWDPAVQQAGVDTGYTPAPNVLRAPDVAIGNVPETPGWVPGAPALAVEYADVGQDEDRLQEKVRDLLAGGTKLVWVVRLAEPRRVEVHAPGRPARTAWPGEHLTAPGILRNPVLVESLYDRKRAEQATLTNLLQRQGYDSLEAVRQEGRLLEARAAIRRVLARRGLSPGTAESARIEGCADLATLERWLDRAIVAASAAEALD